MDLLVLAKEPVPGRAKTRLTPPCTPHEAAEVAAASLADTLAAAVASGADRVVLALEGDVGPWCPASVEVVPQGRGDLAERIEDLWSHAPGPALQIGMDTPQLTPSLLDAAMGRLAGVGCDGDDGSDLDSVLGLAQDGGWWCVGLRRPRPGCFLGIETSRSDTGARQRERLASTGGSVGLLPVLRDVDRWDDALVVAAIAPGTRFATAVAQVADRLEARPELVEVR